MSHIEFIHHILIWKGPITVSISSCVIGLQNVTPNSYVIKPFAKIKIDIIVLIIIDESHCFHIIIYNFGFKEN